MCILYILYAYVYTAYVYTVITVIYTYISKNIYTVYM